MKKQIKYVPGMGWWTQIMNFPTLSRNQSDIQKLKNHNTKNSILIHPFSIQKWTPIN